MFRFNKVILTLLSVVIVGINLFFVGSTVSTALPHSWWIYTLFGILGFLYLLFVGYLSLHLVVALGGNLDRFTVTQLTISFISLYFCYFININIIQYPRKVHEIFFTSY